MHKKPIRVLHIASFQPGGGGIESLLMGVYRNINRDLIQFDFLVGPHKEKSVYQDEIQSLGGKVFSRVNRRKYPIKSLLFLYSFFKKHKEYSIIHHHGSLASLEATIIAKRCGVPSRILHAHSTQHGTIPFFLKIFVVFAKFFFKNDYTHAFACSGDAGKWLFNKKEFTVIKNGIEINNFLFDKEKREMYRNDLGIKNSFVVGHLGRFTEQKNHIFLCDIFYEIYKKNSNAVLLLIGTGPLIESVQEKIELLGISHAVKFLGFREDISELMQTMDLLLLPSLFEGLPLTLVEAQASGLPCVASDVVSQESKLTDYVYYVSLDKGAEYWADYCLTKITPVRNRSEAGKTLMNSEFDIIHTTKILEEFYLKLSA